MKLYSYIIALLPLSLYFVSCSNGPAKPVDKDIVQEPEAFSRHLSDNITKLCEALPDKKGVLNDSVKVKYYQWVSEFYEHHDFAPVWSADKQWNDKAQQLFRFIDSAKFYGLFPQDYHQRALHAINNKFSKDSIETLNSAAWAKADILMTDAFFQLGRHLKLGHFPNDSITQPKVDSIYGKEFFSSQLTLLLKNGNVEAVLDSLEPKHEQYQLIRRELRKFLDTIRFQEATYVFFPNKDTAKMYQQLQKRLVELGFLKKAISKPDTSVLRPVIAKYQRTKGMKADSLITETLVDALNNTSWEKFKRIVINLDRYRQLPEPMPERYIFVNLPEYLLTVHDSDSVAMVSKVVVGGPKTRTPELNSEVYEFITMPYWTVPNSIIIKEMLRRIIANPDYLKKNDYVVLNGKGETMDPHKISWSKYVGKKGIPYLIRQNPGDDNSLGVIKFNFRNKYSVYMHDTNARGYFSRKQRALSHGCVRVQDWEKLAAFLCTGDSIRVKKDSVSYEKVELVMDTIKAWIAREERHYYPVKKRVPVYFRYITCAVKEDKLVFLEDIYKEDKLLREKFFANKSFQ